MNKNLIFIVIMGVLMMGLGLFACAPEAPAPAPTPAPAPEMPEIKWALAMEEATHAHRSVGRWENGFAWRVAQRTNGKFTIDVAVDKELGVGREEYAKAFSEGTIQMGTWSTAAGGGYIPFVAIFDLPFFTSNQASCYAVKDALHDMIVSEMQKLGYQPVTQDSFWINPPQDILAVEPVDDFTDLKGINFRVWRPLDSDLVKAMNGNPVFLSISEVYTALQRGVIDVLTTGNESMLSGSFYEVAKHHYQISLPPGAKYMIVNIAAFNELPDEYKAILIEEANITGEILKSTYADMIYGSIDRLKAVGCTTREFTPEERQAWVEAAKPIWDKWAAENPENQKAYEIGKVALGL